MIPERRKPEERPFSAATDRPPVTSTSAARQLVAFEKKSKLFLAQPYFALTRKRPSKP